MDIDWNDCAAVETVPGRLSGQPVIRGTRVRPQDLIVNREQGDEWLAGNYGLPVRIVREVLAFCDAKAHPASCLMRVLLDQNLPHALRDLLPDHEVSHAFEMGWAELSNGELLAVAEGF